MDEDNDSMDEDNGMDEDDDLLASAKHNNLLAEIKNFIVSSASASKKIGGSINSAMATKPVGLTKETVVQHLNEILLLTSSLSLSEVCKCVLLLWASR